jgi:H+-transporting ATPase
MLLEEKSQGLTTEEATKRLISFGLNSLETKKPSIWFKLGKELLSPTSLMLLLAALLSWLAKRDFDMIFILFLLFMNVGVSVFQENKADKALELLKKQLAIKIKVLRDQNWQIIDSTLLVPGDLIELGLGSVVPADLEVINSQSASLNEAAMTGESLPKEKNIGDKVFSGTYLVSGLLQGLVIHTGNQTEFGETFVMAEGITKKSLLEKDILTISSFLTKFSILGIVILSIILYWAKADLLDIIILDLSLAIAGIPISLPTVFSMLISFGVLNLSKKGAVVRRLSSLNDLADVDVLLTDKTGTLTKNKIELGKILTYGEYTQSQILDFGQLIAAQYPEDIINSAILNFSADQSTSKTNPEVEKSKYHLLKYTPADSNRKRSTLTAEFPKQGELTLSLGAAQIILTLCSVTDAQLEKIEQDIEQAASEGYRVLALAVGKNNQEKAMQFIGMFYLSDTLRSDSLATLNYLKKNGVEVHMLTGDNRAIAARVSKDLHLEGEVLARRGMAAHNWHLALQKKWQQIAAFAEILPADKLAIVQEVSKNRTVAVTGDGINDLPAVKSAQVGFAVQNAVEALKESADIVLLGSGITVIRDAILESRKIFARMYTYAVYRLSESFRLIVTILILGILIRTYPLTPIQLILLAILNDMPMISLAWNRVKIASKPATINVKKRFILSTTFGFVGVLNSLLLYFGAIYFHLDPKVIETMYFLKLTVGGHLLIYVAHTKERWWKYLPSSPVIWATVITQLISSVLALTGWLMPARISFGMVIFIWLWAIFWMQITEVSKVIQQRLLAEED